MECLARTNAGEFVRLKQQMDNQFNTLARSYHDNYIEYSATGNAKYKTAYEAAQKGLEEIVASLTKQVTTNSQNITDAVGSTGLTRFREKQAFLNTIGAGMNTQADRIKQAEMRLPATPPGKTYTNEYFFLSLLLIAIVGLQIV